jgi:hypothetical protein
MATTATLPGAHQWRGNRRWSPRSAIPPSPARTAPIPTDLPTSPAQPAQDCVVRP